MRGISSGDRSSPGRRSVHVVALGGVLAILVLVTVETKILYDRLGVVHEQVGEQWAGVQEILQRRREDIGTRQTDEELKNALRRYNEAVRVYRRTLESASALWMARYLHWSTNTPYIQPGE